ncbi:transposase [Bifidobacterium cebidarum]|uniref:Uncharacterized protein n=1 Tax=Bifidobacterium cebidarum TaxID=2650773 RepID=A0A6I1GJD9_9BIFI|nr:transposase [Bifidobacterium cebidarum]KAB7789477.1 hypothetical protein F7D08_0429 [Bifidobacterium cebidarum]
MTHGKVLFDEGQVRYLNTLPAVRHATHNRITYEQEFKVECLRRDRVGESPTEMFKQAGLPPALVGSKRIERSFSRWRSDPNLNKIVDATMGEHRDFTPVAADADPRDALIREQALRIMNLEQELRHLRIRTGQSAE